MPDAEARRKRQIATAGICPRYSAIESAGAGRRRAINRRSGGAFAVKPPTNRPPRPAGNAALIAAGCFPGLRLGGPVLPVYRAPAKFKCRNNNLRRTGGSRISVICATPPRKRPTPGCFAAFGRCASGTVRRCSRCDGGGHPEVVPLRWFVLNRARRLAGVFNA